MPSLPHQISCLLALSFAAGCVAPAGRNAPLDDPPAPQASPAPGAAAPAPA
ncbi:MAG: hypothetical protein HY721_19540, partial [Planctomycetes bacterium]|nr:hypothetical protein [Planctomycetota bacterium]